jgi:hypothetical protein
VWIHPNLEKSTSTFNGTEGVLHMLNLVITSCTFCRLLTERTSSLLTEADNFLKELEALEDSAALNFVNALEDLLWAFERRSTASYIFQLAVNRSIYHHNVFRYIPQSLTLKSEYSR